MAGLIFVLVFLALLFGVIVPLCTKGSNNQTYRSYGRTTGRNDSRRYDDRYDAYEWRPGPSQESMPRSYLRPRGGCQQILVLLALAFLIFAAAVIYWSVNVQAGGGLF